MAEYKVNPIYIPNLRNEVQSRRVLSKHTLTTLSQSKTGRLISPQWRSGDAKKR